MEGSEGGRGSEGVSEGREWVRGGRRSEGVREEGGSEGVSEGREGWREVRE